MKQKRHTLIVTLFVLFLITPIFFIMNSPYFRVFAGKMLSQGTKFDFSGEKEILRTQTPLWYRSVGKYSSVLYYFGISPNNRIGVVGRDGYVFMGDQSYHNFSQAIFRKNATDADILRWTDSIIESENYLKEKKIPFVFVIGPAKWSVYRDKLPVWSDPLLGKSAFDRVLALGVSLPIIDVRPELIEARSIAETYSKFDNHWTDFGAYVAWQKIGKNIELQLPLFKAFGKDQLERVEISERFKLDDLSYSFGWSKGNIWTEAVLKEPFLPYQILQEDGSYKNAVGTTKTTVFDLPRKTLNENAKYPGKALILMDSQGTSLSPFLHSSFKEVIMVHHGYKDPFSNISSLIEKEKPDIVIYVITERAFLGENSVLSK